MDNTAFLTELLQESDKLNVFCFAHFDNEVLLQLICALLNSHGGWIIGGMEGKKVIDITYSQKEILEIQRLISDKICPVPLVSCTQEDYLGKRVLLITVPKGPLFPYSYGGKFYTLSEKEVVVPDSLELSSFIRRTGYDTYHWEKATNLYCGIEDLDDSLISSVQEKAISNGRIKSFMTNDVENFLSGLKLNEQGLLKNGAVALFGKRNQKILPQCHIRIQIMAIDNADKMGKMCQSLDYYGNLFELRDQGIRALTSILSRFSTYNSPSDTPSNELIYPDGVLEEAITNTLIHCDYSDMTAGIEICVYSDRIEITNAGEMQTRAEDSSTLLSYKLRNPLIVQVFHMSGLTKASGSGITYIKAQMKEKGYPEPQWKSKKGYTTIYLYSILAVFPERTKDF